MVKVKHHPKCPAVDGFGCRCADVRKYEVTIRETVTRYKVVEAISETAAEEEADTNGDSWAVEHEEKGVYVHKVD